MIFNSTFNAIETVGRMNNKRILKGKNGKIWNSAHDYSFSFLHILLLSVHTWCRHNLLFVLFSLSSPHCYSWTPRPFRLTTNTLSSSCMCFVVVKRNNCDNTWTKRWNGFFLDSKLHSLWHFDNCLATTRLKKCFARVVMHTFWIALSMSFILNESPSKNGIYLC